MCTFDLQTTEISAFSRALREHCAQREMGADRRGSSKGSQNAKLVDAMEDVRTVADLQELRRSRSSGVLRSVDVAIRRLMARHIIPEGVPPATLKLAYDTIHETNEGLTNQELFKELCNAAKSKPELQAYTALVTRLWLISPAESVVESMASIVKEVFGVHRQLLHENAAKELIGGTAQTCAVLTVSSAKCREGINSILCAPASPSQRQQKVRSSRVIRPNAAREHPSSTASQVSAAVMTAFSALP